MQKAPGEKLGISIRGGAKGHAGNPCDPTDEGIFISKVRACQPGPRAGKGPGAARPEARPGVPAGEPRGGGRARRPPASGAAAAGGEPAEPAGPHARRGRAAAAQRGRHPLRARLRRLRHQQRPPPPRSVPWGASWPAGHGPVHLLRTGRGSGTGRGGWGVSHLPPLGQPRRARLSGQDLRAQSQARSGPGPPGRVPSTRGHPGGSPGSPCFPALLLSEELAARPPPEGQPQWAPPCPSSSASRGPTQRHCVTRAALPGALVVVRGGGGGVRSPSERPGPWASAVPAGMSRSPADTAV